jgi:hypothetical protein
MCGNNKNHQFTDIKHIHLTKINIQYEKKNEE